MSQFVRVPRTESENLSEKSQRAMQVARPQRCAQRRREHEVGIRRLPQRARLELSFALLDPMCAERGDNFRLCVEAAAAAVGLKSLVEHQGAALEF